MRRGRIRIIKRRVSIHFPHRSFTAITRLVLGTLGRYHRSRVRTPRKIRNFLSTLRVFSVRTQASSHASFCVAFRSTAFPPVNFHMCSHLYTVPTLLSNKHATGLGFRRANMHFSNPTIGGVGCARSRRGPTRITHHVLCVRDLNNILGCGSMTSGVFHDGLYVVSLGFPHVLTRVAHVVRLSGVCEISRLVTLVRSGGPLGVGRRLVHGRLCCHRGVGRFLLTLTLNVHPTGRCGNVSSTITNFIVISTRNQVLICHGARHRIFTSFLFGGAHLRGNDPRGSGCNCLRHRGHTCCLGLGLGVNFTGGSDDSQWTLRHHDGTSFPAEGGYFQTQIDTALDLQSATYPSIVANSREISD